MSTHYASPQNALSKAQALIKVGKKEAALETLVSILQSKNHKCRVWQDTHEKIMETVIALSINARRNIRDALIKYQYLCVEQNPQYFGKIVKLYRTSAFKKGCEAKNEMMKKKSEAETAENESSDQDRMLKSICGPTTIDRYESEYLIPWTDFVWEAHRTVLDVTKNKIKFQDVYHYIAREAFDFCVEFKRINEFGKLTDTIRKHIALSRKYASQPSSVKLETAETQRMYMETYFRQLEAASKLDLWQEVYGCIEEMHEVINTKNGSLPHPSLMKTYYEKLLPIFWQSQNYLFHAYSLSHFYNLSIKAAPLSPVKKRHIISCVLLGTISIQPIEEEDKDNIYNAENQGNLRLANLLGFKRETPTRTRLLKRLQKRGILRDVYPEVKELFNLLETKFGPLTMKANLNRLLNRLSAMQEQYDQEQGENQVKFNLLTYVQRIKTLAVLRLLEQLSTVYKTIRIEKFQSLAPNVSWIIIERFIVKTAREGGLKIQIDHRRKLLDFSDPRMEAAHVRTQLTTLASKLDQIVGRIAPPNPETKARERQQVFEMAQAGVEQEHNAVLKRKEEIEKRKIKYEEDLKAKEKEEEDEKKQKAKERQESENRRLETESKKRQQERDEREKEAKERASKEALVKTIQEKFVGGKSTKSKHSKTVKKLRAAIADVEKVDKDAIEKAKLEFQMKQKLAKDRRLTIDAKRKDYLIRATRIEEKQLLVRYEEEQLKKDRALWDTQYKTHIKTRKEEFKRDLEIKKKLARMKDHIAVMNEMVMERRKTIFAEEFEEFQAKRETLRKKREEEERARLEAEREKKEEEERIRKEEEEKIRKEKEEEERIRKEKEEKILREKENIKKKKEEKERRLKEKLAELDAKSGKKNDQDDSEGEGVRSREPRREWGDDDNDDDNDRKPKWGDDDNNSGGRWRNDRDEDRGNRRDGRSDRDRDRDFDRRDRDRDFDRRDRDRDFDRRDRDRDFDRRDRDRDLDRRGDRDRRDFRRGDDDGGRFGRDRDRDNRGGEEDRGDRWRGGSRDNRGGGNDSRGNRGGRWGDDRPRDMDRRPDDRRFRDEPRRNDRGGYGDERRRDRRDVRDGRGGGKVDDEGFTLVTKPRKRRGNRR